jgi:hypothetical protein
VGPIVRAGGLSIASPAEHLLNLRQTHFLPANFRARELFECSGCALGGASNRRLVTVLDAHNEGVDERSGERR